MNRYTQLIPIIEKLKPATIVEIGTWNGQRAIMMATEALKHQDKVHYTGFDLFEDATDETDERELNVKKHCSIAAVRGRLEDFQQNNLDFPDRTSVCSIPPAACRLSDCRPRRYRNVSQSAAPFRKQYPG